MKALDTNVIARYILNDDPVQSPAAARQLQEPSFVSATVLLECAWVLSSRYGLDRATLAKAFRRLIELPSVTMPRRAGLSWAIDRFSAGADFADMLHIVDAGAVDAFVSFEKDLARAAGPGTPVPIERLES